MGQSLSASFRLRVQQKTQEKIEQKERRRQDRETRYRQEQQMNVNNDILYDTDILTSSASTSRYSSQPDLTTIGNDLPPTPRRQIDPTIPSILPNFPTKQRLRVFKNPYEFNSILF
jgi:hypothetical protein